MIFDDCQRFYLAMFEIGVKPDIFRDAIHTNEKG